jgi:UDP-glucose 4-epimerase
MKVKVDNNINGETPALKGSTKDNPVKAIIKKVELVAAEDLPEQFDNREDDRYQLVVTLGEDMLKWMPNKTSLKSIIAVLGDESDAWLDKEIGIFLIDQNVSGKMKKVAYCVA